jgi:hypothetical protein
VGYEPLPGYRASPSWLLAVLALLASAEAFLLVRLARPLRNARPGSVKPSALSGATMAKANVHTVPHEGGWANRREGAKRVSKVFRTKAEAQSAGRKTAMREKVEHLIHDRDGQVAERNSYVTTPRDSRPRSLVETPEWLEARPTDRGSRRIRRHA